VCLSLFFLSVLHLVATQSGFFSFPKDDLFSLFPPRFGKNFFFPLFSPPRSEIQAASPPLLFLGQEPGFLHSQLLTAILSDACLNENGIPSL